VLALGLAAGVALGAVPVTTTSSSTTGGLQTTPALSVSIALGASSYKHSARPVVLTLTLHYEMQCGQPGKGPLVVALPAQERVPATFPAGSAQVNGKAATVSRSGTTTLDVALPPPPQVMCDVIGPGSLKLVLTKVANLGNPARAGTYGVSAHVNAHAFQAELQVS